MSKDRVSFDGNGRYTIGEKIEQMDVKKEREKRNVNSEVNNSKHNPVSAVKTGGFDINKLRRAAGMSNTSVNKVVTTPEKLIQDGVITNSETSVNVSVNKDVENKKIISREVNKKSSEIEIKHEQSFMTTDNVSTDVKVVEENHSEFSNMKNEKNISIEENKINGINLDVLKSMEDNKDMIIEEKKQNETFSDVNTVNIDGVIYNILPLKDFVSKFGKNITSMSYWFNTVVKNWVKNPGGFFKNSKIDDLFVNCITSVQIKKKNSVVLVLTYNNFVSSCIKDEKTNSWCDGCHLLSVNEDAILLSGKIVSFSFKNSKDVLVL